MRKALRSFGFSVPFLLAATISVNAQNDRFAYAITDVSKDGAGWNALRKLDLRTGVYSDLLFNGTDQKTVAFDATTRKKLEFQPDAKYGNFMQSPFSTGVAAAAFDRKHNRLYFTPMFIDQLRYLDLSTMKWYVVSDQSFTSLGNMHNDEGKIVTRMVIAPNGNGYAITNDGNTFIEFTTGKKPKIIQKGALVDDPANGGISVHNKCSSFGGDMISDDKGNLYILTARNNVFKVNTETKVATHLGAITGLPKNFTVNGAVVDAEGELLVSSAVDGSAYYVVNAKGWTAAPYTLAAGVYRSSDLANSNYLSSNRTTTIEPIARVQPLPNNAIQIYPNPVITSRFTVQFNKVPAGDYTLELTDVMGRVVTQRRVTISLEEQTQDMNIGSTNAKGIYLLKVIDRNKKSAFEQKVMVQ